VEGEEGLLPGRGGELSVRYHSGRARILTLCQDLRAKGQSQVDSFYGAPTRRAGTKVGLSDPTVPSGRAVAQRIKVTLGITG
ncbi:hypothetical protein Golob_001998, partial [Gossypium lobatum]|nr:hypothetical protein [Gossypium lobatum]